MYTQIQRDELARKAQMPIEEELKKELENNSKSGRERIAQYFLKKYSLKTIGDREKERKLYRFEGGVYVSSEAEIRLELQEMLQEQCSNQVRSEILQKLKDLSYAKASDFDPPVNFINLSNGTYDLSQNKLLPHDPAKLFMSKIPVSFDPTADCPRTKKFLGELLDEEDIPLMQEWFGFCLYRDHFLKKALIAVGERDTGKTTLINGLLVKFMGGFENISGESLQKLGTDKFSAAHLWNKYLNVVDDLAFTDIKDNGIFKMLTGGSLITGEFKFVGKFQFKNYAKLTYTCNKVPPIKDADDDAMFSRWIVVEFSKKIEQKDPFILEKITTPEEMSGLLNWSLEGLKRLLNTFEFSYKKQPEEIKRQMLRSGSSIAKFCYDALEEVTGEVISKDSMYESYLVYVKENNLAAESKDKLGKCLQQYSPYVVSRGGKERLWANVALKVDERKKTEAEELLAEYEAQMLPFAES